MTEFTYRAVTRKTAQWIGNAASVAGGYVAVDGPRLELRGGVPYTDPEIAINGALLVMRVPADAGLANEGWAIPEDVLADLLPELAAAGYATSPAPTSLLAIDVGFDPRTRDTLIRLSNWQNGVLHHPEPDSRMEQAECHARDLEEMGETLAGAGYSIVIAQINVNGRDVQCTPQDRAPEGERLGEWDGVAWAIQARSDNYWIVGPSLRGVLSKAGWRAEDLTSLSGDPITPGHEGDPLDAALDAADGEIELIEPPARRCN